MTHCWIFCFLLGLVGTTVGFPSSQITKKKTRSLHHDALESVTRRRSEQERRLSFYPQPLHMNLQMFHQFPMATTQKRNSASNVPKQSNNKQLWYRDRSTAEEAMTTQVTANTAVTHDLPTAVSRRPAENAVQILPITKPTASTLEDWNLFGSVNLPLVKATCMSHATLLMAGLTALSVALMLSNGGPYDFTTLHWNGDTEAFHSLMDWTMTPWRLVEGTLATIPLVALSSSICNSNRLLFCPIHFSVTNTVLSLFGRRVGTKKGEEDSAMQSVSAAAEGTNSLTVLLFSMLIGSFSAISEELVFRGLLPTVVFSYTDSVELALLSQALLFGLGWVRRESSMEDNGVFSLVQSMNGIWYGLIYLVTGGDLIPVAVSHLLYECHIFVGAWKMINDQLDYTEERNRCLNSGNLPRDEQAELDTIQREAGGTLKPETLAYCRNFFYAFDCDHVGTLSRGDVTRAVAYACLQDAVTPTEEKTGAVFDEMIRRRPPSQQETDSREEPEEDRLTLSEFLRLLFALKSKNWSNQLA